MTQKYLTLLIVTCLLIPIGCTVTTYVDKSVTLVVPNNQGELTSIVENTSETTPTTSTDVSPDVSIPLIP